MKMLEWKKTESREMNWPEAKSLEIDGWRLPTRAELINAFDEQVKGFEPYSYWSSTVFLNTQKFSGWTINFDDYGRTCESHISCLNHVRLCK